LAKGEKRARTCPLSAERLRRALQTSSTLAQAHEFLFRQRRCGRGSKRVDEFDADDGFKNSSFGGVLSCRFPSVGAWCLSAVSRSLGGAVINYRF
jgi:hypothetical protein